MSVFLEVNISTLRRSEISLRVGILSHILEPPERRNIFTSKTDMGEGLQTRTHQIAEKRDDLLIRREN